MPSILARYLPRVAGPLLAATLAGCVAQVETSPDTFSVEATRVSDLRGPQVLALRNAYNTPALEYAANQQFGIGNQTWRFDARQMTDTAIVMLQRAFANGAITVAPAADKEITLRVRVAGGRLRFVSPWSEVTGYVILDATLGDGSVVSVKADNNSPLGHQRAYDGAILFALNYLLVEQRFVAYVNRAPLSRATPAPSATPALASPASGNRYPQTGDTWTYRLNEPKRADGPKQRDFIVKISAASSTSVVEQVLIGNIPSGEATHGPERRVLRLTKSLFSPYLLVFHEEARYSGNFGRVQIEDPACTGTYVCDVNARVIGNERITVPAGSFQALKVEVRQNWRASAPHPFVPVEAGGKVLTVWYAKDTKRAIKYQSRATPGTLPSADTDFELELISYKLQ